jgi:hypothetical protein
MYNNKISYIMKSFLNYSKLAIAMLITSSVFVACSDEITENSVNTQYTANTSSIKSVGQAVDLGLPSGTKWANMNVGATSETDNGILFIWGDITGTQISPSNTTSYTDVKAATSLAELFEMFKADEKEGYVLDTTNVFIEAVAPLVNGLDYWTKDSVTIDGKNYSRFEALVLSKLDEIKPKYVNRQVFDFSKIDEDGYVIDFNLIDSTKINYFESTKTSGNDYKEDSYKFKTFAGTSISGAPIYNLIGDAQYDPATANWGANWQMPTTAQLKELMEHCTWEFTGNGYKVTSKQEGNNNYIFLPAAGYRYCEKWYGNGNAGYYAAGEILGTYQFPSMVDQSKDSKGSTSGIENMPNMLIFQHGQYNSLGIYNNLSSSYGVSIRPVAK